MARTPSGAFTRLALILGLAACSQEAAKQADTIRAPAPQGVPAATPPAGAKVSPEALFSALSPVEPRAIPSDVSIACDSAAADLHSVMTAAPKRQDGAFTDSFQGGARVGCRLTIDGPVPHEKPPTGPMSRVSERFTRRGWSNDYRYSADGPNGSDIGMRMRDLLCLLIERDAGGDDEDTTAARAAARDSLASDIETIIECARDVPSNADAGVPDSIWGLAARQGLDSLYAIDLRIQVPPYIEGDFDGDGVADAAVLVSDRRSGKLGIAFVLRGTHRVEIVGAGRAPEGGPDDFSGIDRWDAWRKGSTFDLTIHEPPTLPLIGDALWIARPDSASAFLVFSGNGFKWEARRRW